MRQQLKKLLLDIQAGAPDVRAEFLAAKSQLQSNGAPAEILARNDQALAEFDERAAEFGQIVSGTDDDEKVLKLAAFFEKFPAKRRASKIDPKALPWGSPKATPRMPAETKTAWFQQITRDTKVQLAQAGGLVNIGGVQFSFPPEPDQAPQDADLAETADAQLSPAVRAKALELGHNPVTISNWVRNNVQWLPTWGSIQGAEGTLRTLRGNAFDTASLTIALLRASGIPARYQFGTIDVPAIQMMNWVGGVSNPGAALNLLYEGGIAARGLASGGKIASVRMEHVWVNAYVNWTPSRGGRQGGGITGTPVLAPHGQPQHPNPNAQLNAWIPIDNSFKQYTYTAGLDLKTAVPFDPAALLSAVQDGTELAANNVRMLNESNLRTQLVQYEQRLRDYVDSQNPNATIAEVVGTRIVRSSNPSLLAGTLPHGVVVRAAERSEIPESLRWKITFKLYLSESEKAYGSPVLAYKLLLSQIGTRRISASGVGASQADQDLLSQYAAANASSLPLYLIRQSVQLKLDDVVLAETGAQRMGAAQWWNYVLEGPNFGSIEEDFKFESAVGDAIVFGVDAYGLTFDDVASRAQQVDPNTALENLHHMAIGYWARAESSDQIMAKLSDVVAYRLPSVALFTSPLTIQYSWGIPRLGTFSSYAVDVRRLSVSAEGKSDALAAVKFLRNIGMKNSFLEGRIFEEVLDLAPGGGVSSVSVIAAANQAGIALWTVNAANLSEYLAAATLSSELQQGIIAAVTSGWEVFAPEDPVDIGRWRGGAYVAIDPVSGSGAYIIGGGANGGALETCEFKVQPLVEAIAQRILTQVAIRIALFLAAEAGLVVASALVPPAAPFLAQAMVMVGIVFITFSANAAAGKCGKSKDCHRGRFQAQGLDILRNIKKSDTYSRPWALPVAPSLAEGPGLLEDLKAKLLPSELVRRTVYFAQMDAYIRTAASAGGICAPFPGKSFQSLDQSSADSKDRVRVDLEVNAGAAFTN